ncbi:MAG: hypothetical protein FWE50_02195 [Alphaproteobacteria bacterium]|nr:hypothetical protein [Alphaproteobacteria bacterium]
MRARKNNFYQRGSMMVEILLSLAIAAAALPFVLREMDTRTIRAENVRIARDIGSVRDALEKYMELHKRELLTPIGATITRVRISDLKEFGTLPKEYNRFQARILKSRDRGGRAVLSGLVVFDSENISPVRTREIAELGGESTGFVEKSEAYGAFGTWRSKTNVFDVKFGKDAIVESTGTILSGGDFLWRLPSPDSADATMLSDLSLGGYNIKEAGLVDAYNAEFKEIMKAGFINARKVQISPRPNWDTFFAVSGEALVSGSLTSDSRSMEVGTELYLNSTARLSRLDAGELWVRDLTLSGLSISGSEKPALLRVNQTIDMVRGRVTARSITVGYAGTIAPRLSVSEKVEDSENPGYFWDFRSDTAVFHDSSFAILNKMMKDAVKSESKASKTVTEDIMGKVSANSNATVSDFVRALNDIQNRVRQKYNGLNMIKYGVQ